MYRIYLRILRNFSLGNEVIKALLVVPFNYVEFVLGASKVLVLALLVIYCAYACKRS